MKKLVSVISLFSALLFFSCSKTSDAVEGHLTGKWILIETLADPGDGSGTWRPADPPNHFYLTFKTDSTVESNLYTGPGGLKRYSLLTDSTINFTYNNGGSVNLRYKIEAAFLTITGGCIEACGSKFSKSSLTH
jgi:hypothetical protein